MSKNGKHPEEDRDALLPKWPNRKRKGLDIVGTKEAADILGVERTRVGKWTKLGIMPPMAKKLAATPVWYREDVEKLIPWVEANRRLPVDDAAAAR